MKVNIISNNQKISGLTQDVNLLRGILTIVFDKDVEISVVPHVFPQCIEADYNIFLEVINPSLFSYARRNIWIPNPEWTYKSWTPYLHMIDEIWVKTQEALRIFNETVDYKKPVKFIGWTSIDKAWSLDQKKNYSKAIVPVGKNIFRQPKSIFQAYIKLKEENPSLYGKLPVLHVVYSPQDMTIVCPEQIQDKVILKAEVMKQNEYDELMKECGLAICLSVAEGFCHAVNECMSAGCNLILSPILPFREDLVGDIQVGTWYATESNSVPQPDRFGTYVDVSVDSVVQCFTDYVTTSFKEKRSGSEVSRKLYETRHDLWIETMKEHLKNSLPNPEVSYNLKSQLPKEDDLPDISILCITKDRRIFMPLLKYCYMIQSYPEDKLELVLVDDGTDSIEDTLIGVPNVKYVRADPGMTISQKRNLAVQNAMYDILVTMDDDDVYPNNSVLQRVAMMLMEPKKECGFCTTIPCYDIVKYASFMNVPPTHLTMSERVSEATMVFTRKFWEERNFDDSVHIGEGNAFIRGREQMCREISPQEVIVSLIHPKNTSSRRLPVNLQSNGCHWGFNEKLFALVTQIGQDLNTLDQTESGETCGESSSCHGGDGDHPLQQ
jgi:hypothetical protein